ncbi:MAG: hypothetical protein ABFD86_02225 [Bryobacteraceae bacterium]
MTRRWLVGDFVAAAEEGVGMVCSWAREDGGGGGPAPTSKIVGQQSVHPLSFKSSAPQQHGGETGVEFARQRMVGTVMLHIGLVLRPHQDRSSRQDADEVSVLSAQLR